ncbi:Calmodulin, partial [Sarracenia purpurea var. burkii]
EPSPDSVIKLGGSAEQGSQSTRPDPGSKLVGPLQQPADQRNCFGHQIDGPVDQQPEHQTQPSRATSSVELTPTTSRANSATKAPDSAEQCNLISGLGAEQHSLCAEQSDVCIEQRDLMCVERCDLSGSKQSSATLFRYSESRTKCKQPENPHGITSILREEEARFSLRRTFSRPSPDGFMVVVSQLSCSGRRRTQTNIQKEFDVNDDEKISSTELGLILGMLGYTATEEELETMIREVDADGDGCIKLYEFTELNAKNIDPDEVSKNLKEAFSRSLPTKCKNGYSDYLIEEEAD